MGQLINVLIPLLIGCICYFLPAPEGLSVRGWHLFVIFIATIVGIILKPYPMGVIALFGLIAACLTGTLDLGKEGLSGYGSPVIWLIVYVFFIARALIKTQLGTRIAYFFVSLLGRYSLGLGYGLAVTELMIAPVIPSNAARAGGIMYPIMKSIAESLGSRPGDGTERKLGAYLTQICCHANLITSGIFLTAMAANPLAQTLAATQGVTITWGNWFIASVVPGLLSLFILPLALYIVYPPEVKVLPHAVDLAKSKLKEMGPMKPQEWIMTGIFVFMLVLWVGGENYGISSTLTALAGLILLIATNILDWEDILKEKEAWHTLIWFAVLVTMAKYLQDFGFVTWFSVSVGKLFSGFEWYTTFLGLILVYFYSHYIFASNTAHVAAMYGAFLSIAIAAGVPALLAALVFGFCSSLFSSMTHYGSASSVVLY
ncbi:MAG: DASS family sodium-coupled anion symporter, partial [Proteobacteria bacterium]|nr:DASS family sodium-coupled anion symporter [Pseudomonadota bacterium]